jgi:hypothetical protein
MYSASLSDSPGLLVVGTLYFLLCVGSHARWLWWFLPHVARFRTWSKPGIVIHYARELDQLWDWSILAQHCEKEAEDLGRRVGFALRRPIVVYFFAAHTTIGRIFGRHYGGTALHHANAIVIPLDCCWQEMMRHELVHLFSARWTPRTCTLLNEGLATCLQETWGGRPIDLLALPLLGNGALRLPALLDRKFFFSDPYRRFCYILAGSFTGFLIRRFGWDTYRRLFCMAVRVRFHVALQRCCGQSLERAEAEWRAELQTVAVLRARLERELST